MPFWRFCQKWTPRDREDSLRWMEHERSHFWEKSYYNIFRGAIWGFLLKSIWYAETSFRKLPLSFFFYHSWTAALWPLTVLLRGVNLVFWVFFFLFFYWNCLSLGLDEGFGLEHIADGDETRGHIACSVLFGGSKIAYAMSLRTCLAHWYFFVFVFEGVWNLSNRGVVNSCLCLE